VPELKKNNTPVRATARSGQGKKKNPFRVAFFTSHPTQYHSPFFRCLAREPGIDLTVLYFRDFGIGKKSWDPGFGQAISWDIPLLEGYRHRFLRNLSPRPSSGMLGQFNPGLFPYLRRERPDAVIVHGWMSASCWLAVASARVLRIPVILKGEADLLRRRGRIKQILRRGPMRFLAFSAAAGLCSCSANRDFFLAAGFPRHRLFPFPCAVDNDFFREKALEEENSPALRESLGLAPDTILVVSVGKLIPRKRPLDLVRALLEGGEGTALILVGDGELRPEIENLPGIAGRVFVTGFVNQGRLGRYYRAADVFALASEWDPSPKALNEAMNFGLPLLVSSGVGTARDLVEPDRNGYVFPPGEVKTLAAHIRKLAGDRELRLRMGQRSQKIVEDWSYGAEVAGTLAAVRAAVEDKA